MKYEFDAPIQTQDGGGSYVEFPYDVRQEFGVKGQVRVKATFDGVPYRGSLVRMGGIRHILGMLKEIQKRTGKGPGDTVHVTVEQDLERRVAEVPQELIDALAGDADALRFLDSLAFTYRHEYAAYIESAKTDETRRRHVEEAAERIRGHRKMRG